jgi:hypothetical protein
VHAQPKIEGQDVTPILAWTLTWSEVASGASIIFDLRITAITGEPEAETQDRFVAEAIRIAGAFLRKQAHKGTRAQRY